jgi:hypothetical protein
MTRRSVWTITAALLVAALLSGVSLLGAQSSTGRISGRIIDAATGRGLSDAGIQVVGTTMGTQSQLDGRYSITTIPSGTVSLHVRLIGYQPKTVTGIVLPPGAAVEQNIALEVATVQLQAVEVTAAAERGSVNEALDEQRNATGIVNAISQEQIARSPDADAAAAMQRVSGVSVQEGKYVLVRGLGERYTQTTLNGARLPSPEPDRKVVPLDLFPAGLLQSVTTSKTFTPDQSGDFSGAQVNIQTREFPAKRTFTYSASFGYNTKATGKDVLEAPRTGGELLALVNGERSLPAIVRRGGNFQQTSQDDFNRMINAFRNSWMPSTRSGTPNGSFGMSVGGNDPVFGQRIGYLLSGTYSYSQEVRADASRATARVGGSGEAVEEDRWTGDMARSSVLWGGLLNLSTLVGSNTRIALDNTYNRTADNEAFSEAGFIENIGSDAALDRLRYVERSLYSSQLSGEHELGLGRHRVQWSATASGVQRLEPDRSEVTYLLNGPGGAPRWLSTQEGATRTFGDLNEHSFEGALNYQLALGAARTTLIKVGGLTRTTTREADNRAYGIIAPILSDADRALPPEQLFDGRFTSDGAHVFQLVPLSQGGSYTADDRLYAGYAMAEIPIGSRLRFIGGARIEASDVTVDAQSTLGEAFRAAPTYTDVLPSAALTIKLTENQNLRVSASQTLARPEYRELAGVTYRDPITQLNRRGNPDLQRTLIQNADVRWEWYPDVGEVVSLAVFGKHFDDPIESVYQGASQGRLVTFVNADAGRNYGVELELRKNLAFAGRALEPFTFFSNITVMKSEIELGSSAASNTNPDRAMVGQSPYLINAGLSYDRGPWSATALYNRIGQRIVDAGENPLPDVKEQPRDAFDVSLRFPIMGSLFARFDARNLFDARYLVTQGDVVRESYRTGRIVQMGFTWRR